MPIGGSDFGTTPPPGTELVLANVWYDGQVVIRSGGSLTSTTGVTVSTLAAAPATPTGAAVLYSSNGGVLTAVSPTGQVTTVGGVTQVQTSTVTVTANAITALQSYTVPANDPIAGAVYNMEGYGTYTTTGTPTDTITLLWGGTGGTALATLTTAAFGAVTNIPFSYDAIVTFRSATSCWANVTFTFGAAGAGATYVATPTTATTVTTTSANALVLANTWSATGNSISLVGGIVERLA